jgi:hypothetical protein
MVMQQSINKVMTRCHETATTATENKQTLISQSTRCHLYSSARAKESKRGERATLCKHLANVQPPKNTDQLQFENIKSRKIDLHFYRIIALEQQ